MSITKRRAYRVLAAAAFPAALFCASAPGQAAPILGNARSFAIFGGASVTNTGSTVITGELGVSPGTSVTGFYAPGVVNGGTIHLNDGLAISAAADFLSAYTSLGGSSVTQNLTGGDLGVGILGSLTPGVYKFDTTAQLTGALTLDGGNDPSAQFVFLIGSALTTSSASSVLLTNGAFFDNIFWITGTGASLGAGTAFSGSILAGSSITMDAGATIVCGRALAQASVTMINNQISTDCQPSGDGGGTTDVPEPASLFLLALGFFSLMAATWNRRRYANAPRTLRLGCDLNLREKLATRGV